MGLRTVANAILAWTLLACLVALPIEAQIVSPAVRDAADDALADEVNRYVNPLRERLPLEMRFIKRAGQLTDKQVLLLEAAGRAAIDMLSQETAKALRQRPQAGVRQQAMLVNGSEVVIPSTLDREIVTAPGDVLRRLLSQAFKGVYPQVCERLAHESERLEARRRRAEALAYVAAVDGRVFLSPKQRRDFCELLFANSANASWRPRQGVPVVNSSVHRLFVSATGNRIRGFIVPEAELATILPAPQRAEVEDAQRPEQNEVAVVRNVIRNPANAAVGPAAALAGQQADQQKIAQRQIQVQLLAMQQIRQAKLAGPQVVRHGPSPEDVCLRLTAHAQRLVETVNAVCGLSQHQRDKLLLSATLDIERWREQFLREPEQAPDEQQVVIRVARASDDDLRLPLMIFDDAASSFRKAVERQLSDDQRRLLNAAEDDRRAFQRRALVEAVTIGFERATALTAEGCDHLSDSLYDLLTSADRPVTLDLLRDWLRQIASLPEERMRPLFSDVQWPFAREHWQSLPELSEPIDDEVVKAVGPVKRNGKR